MFLPAAPLARMRPVALRRTRGDGFLDDDGSTSSEPRGAPYCFFLGIVGGAARPRGSSLGPGCAHRHTLVRFALARCTDWGRARLSYPHPSSASSLFGVGVRVWRHSGFTRSPSPFVLASVDRGGRICPPLLSPAACCSTGALRLLPALPPPLPPFVETHFRALVSLSHPWL